MLVLEVLIISSSNAPIANLLDFGLKSTTLCQALAKSDTVCLTESKNPHSTQSSEIEQHSNQDETVKPSFGVVIAGYSSGFYHQGRKDALCNLLTKIYLII